MAISDNEGRNPEQHEEDLSEEDRNPRHKRSSASWRDIVEGGQAQGSGTRAPSSSRYGAFSEGQNRGASSSRQHKSPATRAKEPRPSREHAERLYTQQEVIELLKSRRSNEESEIEEGWSPVISKATKKKTVMQTREKLGISKKKRKIACWECLGTDHISVDCPKGRTCLYCHRHGHLIADCPRKSPKATARRSSNSWEEEPQPTAQVFMHVSDEMMASKLELQKTVGVLIRTHGQSSIEDMIEGIKATSKRLSQFNWRPFRLGRDTLIKFPDEQTLSFFASRTTSLECPRGNFRVNRWKSGEDRANQYRFPQCRWVLIKGLPPYALVKECICILDQELCSIG